MDIISLITNAISFLPIFLYGCVGEIITEKSGHLNLGIPGIMCAGTAGGCFGAYVCLKLTSNSTNPSWILLVLLGIFFALLFASLIGLIYAFLTVSLRCNQNISGLAITTLGTGFTQAFMDILTNSSEIREYFDVAGNVYARSFGFSDKLGFVGEILFSHGIAVYLAIILAIATALFLKKTRAGLHLRAIGENPAAADAVGINVSKYKYSAIAVGSGIAGLGGFFFVMDYLKGAWENASTIEGYGWLCIALVIFTLWKPDLSILGALIFGALSALPYLSNTQVKSTKEFIKILPYIVTIIVLIFTSIFDSKNAQPPASLGLNYFREER